ncbi:MAG TPA: HEAT repeat domain-containing protein [Alloacidobacterium sp.]|nr:HEAT repeat domain-containing protein [Alloacidobacterium sp.]
MRFQRHLAILACCLGLGFTALAQANPPKQQQPNDYGVVGDTGEPDQPVSHPAATQSSADTLETAWQMLETGSKDPKEQTRIDALNAVGTLDGVKRAETILEDAIKDQNVDVRVAAVVAAGNMQDENLIPILRQSLDDPAPEVIFAAAVSLWKMHDPSGINILYGVLAGDRKTKGSLMETGERQASKDLHDPSTLAKIGAEQGAYALLGPFGIGLDAARLMMKSNSANSARVLTVSLLSQDHSDATRDEFIAALGDKNYFVRAGSARALGAFHGKEVTDALQGSFDDSKPSVRFMAAASYIRSSQPVQPERKPSRRRAKTKSGGKGLK